MCDVFSWVALAVIAALAFGIYWAYKKVQGLGR